jgi:DNA-binding transcriptional ArsR family regulator
MASEQSSEKAEISLFDAKCRRRTAASGEDGKYESERAMTETMRLSVPLNALRAFEAAARHMSIKDAAEEIGVTPSAVSHQLRILEDLLGVELMRISPSASRGSFRLSRQ